MTAKRADIQAAKDRALQWFKPLVGDVAVGVIRRTDGTLGLKVHVTSDIPDTVRIPDEINGFPLQIERIGAVRKLTP